MEKFEEQLINIETKDYSSMVLSADKLYLLGKRVPDISAFWEAYEKKGMLTMAATMEPSEVKQFMFEQGEKTVNLSYTKTFALGMPGYFEFQNQPDLESFVNYIEKNWFFKRSDTTLSPMKATIPYLVGLFLTILITGSILYLNIYGGNVRANIIFILLVKLSETIGFIGSLILSLVIMALVIKSMLSAYKNPPRKTTLERMT